IRARPNRHARSFSGLLADLHGDPVPMVMRHDMAPHQVARAFIAAVEIDVVGIAVFRIVVFIAVTIIRSDEPAALEEDVWPKPGTDMRPDHARMKSVATATRYTVERSESATAAVPTAAATADVTTKAAMAAKSTTRLRHSGREHTQRRRC